MGQSGMQPPPQQVSDYHWSTSTANSLDKWQQLEDLQFSCASMRTHYGEQKGQQLPLQMLEEATIAIQSQLRVQGRLM
eukprot:11648493-Prorocentrum_lima.AAC.1